MELITELDIRKIAEDVLYKFIIPSYERHEHNYTGELMNSFNVRVDQNKATFSALERASFLIIGRRPNKDQSDEAVNNWVKWFAPNVFWPWMQTKGTIGNPYALAHSIAREGTKQHRKPSVHFMEVLNDPEVSEFVRRSIGSAVKFRVMSVLRSDLIKLRYAGDGN